MCIRDRVAAELVEHERARWRAFGRAGSLAHARRRLLALPRLIAREQLDDLLAHLVEVGTELDQDLCLSLIHI